MSKSYQVPFYVNAVVYSASGMVLYLVLLIKHTKKSPTYIDEVKVSVAKDMDLEAKA